MKDTGEWRDSIELRRAHSAFIVFFFLMGAGLSTSCGETFSGIDAAMPAAGAAGTDPTGAAGEGNLEAGGASGIAGASTAPADGGSSAGGEGGATAGTGGDDASGTGGTAGRGGEPNTPPPPCDWTQPVHGCAVTAKDGIFVTPEGDDEADGTPEQPLASLREGVARARAMAKRRPVFVCAASFDEHVEIHHDGIRLQGGFACPESTTDVWIYNAGERPRLAPSTQGYALRVRDAEKITVADFELRVVNGEVLGDNSVAVFATNAIDVAFERTLIQSGNGADGEPGVLMPYKYVDLPESNPATEEIGAEPLTCTCAGSAIPTVGGRGGNGGAERTDGDAGQPLYAGTGAGGRAFEQDCAVARGQDGGDAPATRAEPGARVLGAATISGWEPSTANIGRTGAPGQGGGGGAGVLSGAKFAALGGQSGQCGGCGGQGGAGGRAGGASIGVLSYVSRVTLLDSEIRTGQGGTGGAGAPGQAGQRGRTRLSRDCQSGGGGGKGGTGGLGGGGAGGISVGVVWTGGTAPALESTQVFTGEAGMPGGVDGENKAIPGVSLAVLAAP